MNAIKIELPTEPHLKLASALLEACGSNNLEVAQQLVKLGADINVPSCAVQNNETTTGPSALHFAVMHNNYELINLLLQAGADVNLEDMGGKKPLNIVRWDQLHSEPSWLRKIVQATKDINKPSRQGYTILHSAVKLAAPEFVEMLLNHGASVNESSQEYHVLYEVLYSKNPTTFRLIWNLTDKQFFKSLVEPEMFIMLMLNYGWYKPDKVTCLYDVLNVIGTLALYRYEDYSLLFIAMAEFGYDNLVDDEDTEKKLMHTKWPTFELGDPEFLKINLCEVIRRLHAHGTDLSSPPNKDAILHFCYKYNISKSTQRQYELLDTIIELGVDLSDLDLTFACANYPKFALLLLQYSSVNPSDLFQAARMVLRCDIQFLNFITSLLMLCSPPHEFRMICHLSLNMTFKRVAIPRFKNRNTEGYSIRPFFLCINKSEFDDPYVTAERFALLNKVTRLLKIDRLPTLQELARNCIRLCLKDKTSKEFLHAVDSLNIPEYIRDIIQCRAPVCSFRENDLGDMAAPVFPFSDFRRRSNSTSSDTLPHNLQTFQPESNLSPLFIDWNNSSEEEEQIVADDRNLLELESEEPRINYVKKFKKFLCRFLVITTLIISVYHLLEYVTR